MTTERAFRIKTPAPGSTALRERRFVLAALTAVTALAWAYLIHTALDMPEMSTARAMQPPAWDAAYFLAMLVMWIVMMAGMMLPSAAPAILLYAALELRTGARAAAFRAAVSFAAGYLAIWSAFSVLATAAQWGLGESALLSPMRVSTTPVLTGLLFLAAAAYQLTPLKNACLAHCRSPVEFLTRRRRSGSLGALRLGLEHGAYCLGCCWVLMALLFALGVMNLLWVAAIAVFVLAEKVLPAGPRLGRVGGVLMAGAGIALLAAA